MLPADGSETPAPMRVYSRRCLPLSASSHASALHRSSIINHTDISSDDSSEGEREGKPKGAKRVRKKSRSSQVPFPGI